MNKEKEITGKVADVLSSLEGMKPASPGPFFYTRVQARLHKQGKSVWDHVSLLITRPAVAFTVVCVILLMNMLVFLQQKNVSSTLADQQEQSYYEEYNNTADNFYDFAINEH